MRIVFAFPIFLLLVGCDQSNERDMANCRAEALSASSSDSGQLDDYEKSCMAAKGYHFSSMPYRCGHGDLYADAECYVR